MIYGCAYQRDAERRTIRWAPVDGVGNALAARIKADVGGLEVDEEADAVIVGYGVADADYALMEGEFIYSLNRLNVAITRARCKAIVCLSAPLLTPPVSAFSREELIEGLSFMRSLRDFVTRSGEEHSFELPRSPEGTVLRVLRTA